jgi:hypothetical protein
MRTTTTIALVLTAAAGAACKPKDDTSQAKLIVQQGDACNKGLVRGKVYKFVGGKDKVAEDLLFHDDNDVSIRESTSRKNEVWGYDVGRSNFDELPAGQAPSGQTHCYVTLRGSGRIFKLNDQYEKMPDSPLTEIRRARDDSRVFIFAPKVAPGAPNGQRMSPVDAAGAAAGLGRFVNPELWTLGELERTSEPCARMRPDQASLVAADVANDPDLQRAVQSMGRGQRGSETLARDTAFFYWLRSGDGWVAVNAADGRQAPSPPPDGAYLPCRANAPSDEPVRPGAWIEMSLWFRDEVASACPATRVPAIVEAGRTLTETEVPADSVVALLTGADKSVWSLTPNGLRRMDVLGDAPGRVELRESLDQNAPARVICAARGDIGAQAAYKFGLGREY